MPAVRNWRWWTVTLRGIAAIVFGVFTLAAPRQAVIVFGAFAMIDGILAFALPARNSVQPRGTVFLRGLVSIGAGLFVLIAPPLSVAQALLLIAGWAIASGTIEIIMAVEQHRRVRHEWLLAIEGFVSIGFGIAVILFPLSGATALALWLGAYALVLGGILVASSVRLRAHRVGTTVVTA